MQVKDWIEEWLLVWPLDVQSGGETVRSKAEYCVKKMQKLCDKHPNYTKSTIFTATRNYLREMAANNWFGIRRAMYFIDKLGVGSALEAYCDKVLNASAPLSADVIPEYNPMDDYI